MPEETDVMTQPVPAHLVEQLKDASKELALRQSAYLTAKSRAKDAKDALDDVTDEFIAAANAIIPVDGFPEDTPMAGETDDTPPAEEADEDPVEPEQDTPETADPNVEF